MPLGGAGARPAGSCLDGVPALWRHVEAVELRCLKEALPHKAQVHVVRDQEGRTAYEIRGRCADLFALVPRLTAAELPVHVTVDGRATVTGGRYTPSCRAARTSDCTCSCGGRNHGVAISNWPLVASSEIPDPQNPDGALLRREYLLAPSSSEPDAPQNGNHDRE